MNMVFRAHSVMAKLLPVDLKSRKQLAVITPSFVLIPVVRHPSVKISQVAALLPELRSAVTQERRRPTAVRFSDELCNFIEIARDDAKALSFRTDDPKSFGKLQALQPFHALIGRSYAYGGSDEVLSLTDSNQGSTFAAGMQGSGKSTFVRAYLSTMTYATSPDLLHVYLIDMKRRSLVAYESLPHVVAAAYTPEAAAQVVETVYKEMEARKSKPQPHRTLLVIDELRELKYADGDLLEMVSRIASLGRELGVPLLCATQKPLSSELGPIIKSQFAVRVVGTLEDATASHTVTGRAGLNAHLLEGKGSMLMVATARQPTRIQVYNFDEPLVTELAEMTRRRWQNVARPQPMAIVAPAESRAITMPGRSSRAEGDAQKIAEVFSQYYRPESNGFVNGAKSRFTKLIVGDGATYEGGNAARVDKAIQHLLRERSAAQ